MPARGTNPMLPRQTQFPGPVGFRLPNFWGSRFLYLAPLPSKQRVPPIHLPNHSLPRSGRLEAGAPSAEDLPRQDLPLAQPEE